MKRSIRSITLTTALAAVLAIALRPPAPFPAAARLWPSRPPPWPTRPSRRSPGKFSARGPTVRPPHPRAVPTSPMRKSPKIKSLGLKAAIVMHYGGNDWAHAQINGLNDEFERPASRSLPPPMRIRAENSGLGPGDGDGRQARHHRVDPDRPGRHRILPIGRWQRAARSSFSWTMFRRLEAGKDYVSVVSATTRATVWSRHI